MEFESLHVALEFILTAALPWHPGSQRDLHERVASSRAGFAAELLAFRGEPADRRRQGPGSRARGGRWASRGTSEGWNENIQDGLA